MAQGHRGMNCIRIKSVTQKKKGGDLRPKTKDLIETDLFVRLRTY